MRQKTVRTRPENEQTEFLKFYLLSAFRFIFAATCVYITVEVVVESPYLPELSSIFGLALLPGCFKSVISRHHRIMKHYLFVVGNGLLITNSYFTGGIHSSLMPWLAISAALSAFVLPLVSMLSFTCVSAIATIVFAFKQYGVDTSSFGILSPESALLERTASLLSALIFSTFIFSRFKVYLENIQTDFSKLSKVQSNILSIFDETEDFIGMADSHGKVVYHNKAFTKVTGKTNEDISEMHIPQFHPEWATKIVLEKGIPQALEVGSWTGETAIFDGQGEEVPVLQTIIVHKDSSGKSEFTSTLMKDIRKIKEREERLRKAKEFSENAAKLKSEFLATISHELRTPMNGIMGMTSLAKDEVKDQKILDMLEIIERSGESLLVLLNDILDFSKFEAGKLQLEKINFNLYALMNDIKEVMEPVAIAKSIALDLCIEKDTLKWAKGDPTRLRQVVINLVSNAIKFSEQGTVVIQVNEIQRTDHTGRMIQVAVKDEGIGITESQKDKLFKPFSQVDASTTRKFGGTGLGLSISKLLVEAANGKLWFESREKRGSTFAFTFELSEGVEEVASPVLALSTNIDLKILIAEDDAVNRTVIMRYLERHRIKPDFVEDGVQAVAHATQNTYDLILMDCHMPNMDGFEATRLIAKELGVQKPYIYAVTASVMQEEIDRCLAAGMDGVLAKPLRAEDLNALLSDVCMFKEAGKKVS